MSTLIVPVATIDELKPHPNADRLEIAQILGWQVVVQKGQFTIGEAVAYVPPDTMLPPHVSDRLGVTKYLSNGRVRQVRLRGEPSFGFVAPRPDLMPIGANVASIFEATKYEPPVRVGVADVLPDDARFPSYTEIENMRNFPDVFHDGEQVIVTEKIHGSNVRVGVVEGERMAGSKRIRRAQPARGMEHNLYWYAWSLAPIEALLTDLGRDHKQVVLYGEVYGSAVQKGFAYGAIGTVGFRAFDLLIDGRYSDVESFTTICRDYDIATVPLLGEGPYSLEWIRRMSQGTTVLSDTHMREGVVVKPIVERTDPRIGRVILKYISDQYLFGDVQEVGDI